MPDYVGGRVYFLSAALKGGRRGRAKTAMNGRYKFTYSPYVLGNLVSENKQTSKSVIFLNKLFGFFKV